MSLIADAVRRLRSGNGWALIVVGEAGIGKTRLAEYLGDAAATAGVDIVHGRALPAGFGGSLRPVAEILLELTRDRAVPGDPGLAPYVSVLASLAPHWRDPGWSAPAEPVVVRAEAVVRVLQWATGGAGVVVILEDLHWADDAALAVIRYLADYASEVPVLVLVFGTIRTGEGRADARALLEAGGAQICPIGPSPTTRHARWLPNAQRPDRQPGNRSQWWCGRQEACRCWSRICWPPVTWAGSRHGSPTPCARGWPAWMPASGRCYAPRRCSAAGSTGGCWTRLPESSAQT